MEQIPGLGYFATPRELVPLLPDKCINCDFARFLIGYACLRTDENPTPLEVIKDISEKCSGQTESDPQSDYYMESFDRSGCPYVHIKQDNAGSQP